MGKLRADNARTSVIALSGRPMAGKAISATCQIRKAIAA
jgi:hypothetical protein